MREMSTLIFVSQRIFLTAIPALLPEFMNKICTNSYIGAAYVLFSTMLLSQLIIMGAKKIKILEYLR